MLHFAIISSTMTTVLLISNVALLACPWINNNPFRSVILLVDRVSNR